MRTARLGARESARDIFVLGLHNTHGLERQALQIMRRQFDRVQSYPELADALRRHVDETEHQRRRLEDILHRLGERPSCVKEAAFGALGDLAALSHAGARDEIVKNMLANHAFENYEIAAYTALITLADAAGFSQFAGLEQSLKEERAMAQRMAELIEPIVRKYVALATEGLQADR